MWSVGTIVLVDFDSKILFEKHVTRLTTIYLFFQLLVLLRTNHLNPRTIIADQQKAFAATYFIVQLAKIGIHLKLVPRDRHSEFAGIVERSIQSIKAMARAGLFSALLTSAYWPFAVPNAVYVKNRMFHDSLKCTPWEKHYGYKAEIKHLRKFGCLTYMVNAKTKNQDKFKPFATPGIFLGYTNNNFSVLTARIFNPKSNKVLFIQFSDLKIYRITNVKSIFRVCGF